MYKILAYALVIAALPVLAPVVLLSGTVGVLTLLAFAAAGHSIPWRSLSTWTPEKIDG